MSEYHDRLNEVNKKCDDPNVTVWDSIDRPIRPLIYQLHRIGLITKFSCCGFNYDGEEEPKNHHRTQTYFFVHTPRQPNQIVPFFSMVDMAKANGWTIAYHTSYLWNVYYENPKPMKELYQKKDGEDVAIHDYESQVLAIYRLTKVLEKIPTVELPDSEHIEIVDGNKSYEDIGIDEWQVKPKRSISLKIAKAQLDMDKKNKEIKKEIEEITEGDI